MLNLAAKCSLPQKGVLPQAFRSRVIVTAMFRQSDAFWDPLTKIPIIRSERKIYVMFYVDISTKCSEDEYPRRYRRQLQNLLNANVLTDVQMKYCGQLKSVDDRYRLSNDVRTGILRYV